VNGGAGAASPVRVMAPGPAAGASLPPLPAVQFLVDALPPGAASQPHTAPAAPAAPAWWQLRARLLRVLALIERLEARDREGAPRHPGRGRALSV
jgi:phytoene synthase